MTLFRKKTHQEYQIVLLAQKTVLGYNIIYNNLFFDKQHNHYGTKRIKL